MCDKFAEGKRPFAAVRTRANDDVYCLKTLAARSSVRTQWSHSAFFFKKRQLDHLAKEVCFEISFRGGRAQSRTVA